MKKIYNQSFYVNSKKKTSVYYLGLALCFSLLIHFNVYSQQTTYSFVTAGATGSIGPTQAQLNTAYLSTNLSGMVTTTNGIQSWTVPANGLYAIDISAASGGNAPTYNKVGGLGARMQGQFNLNAGQVLRILVGQSGGNGCGDGGGGGGSYVVNTGTLLIAAGGGGGCTSDQNGVNGTTVTAGTTDSPSVSLGGTNGGGGLTCTTGSHNGGGGGGYNGNGQTGSGGGGISFNNGGMGGAPFFNTQEGPSGGFGGGGGGSYCTVGGGGGGGYSGGAGGQHLNQCISNGSRTGGGGGGSYNVGSNQINTIGYQGGNGRVIITSLCNISLNATSSNTICNGSSITLTTNAVSGISWSNGSTNASIVVSPTVTTSYSVVGTSSAACATSAAMLITVQNTSLSSSASSNSVCLNTSVTLSGSGANTYTWSGGVVNGVAFVPQATAVYTLTGTGACGTFSTTQTISVSALPVVGLASSSVVCAGHVTTLSAGGATTYSWMPGNLTGPSIIVSPLATTIYTINGATGVCGGTSTLAVTANPNPTVTSASSSTNVCAGQTVTFTAFGAVSYSWQTGSTSSSIVVSPTTPTAIIVYGTNSFGCTSNTAQVVLVSPSPTLSVIASNTLICLGGSVNFSATSTSNNYSWSTGATGATETVSPTSNTSYTVSSSNPICTSSQIINVSLFTQTLSVSPSTAICAGTTVNLNASGGTTYSWSDGSTSSGISVSPNTTTVYIVTANTQTNNMNCASSGTINITVNPNPTLAVVFTKTVICKGESSTMTASGASSYLWNTSAAVASITVSPTANTNYTVTGTNADGCVNTKTLSLKVLPCVGINELNGDNYQLSIYPNPSNGQFTIKSDVSISLNVINELGQSIRTITLNDTNKHEVNLNDLANGIYFIVGKNESVNVSQKIVVAK